MSLAVTVCCRVAENEIQNKQARLLHIPFNLPCYSSISPPPHSSAPYSFFFLSLSPHTLFFLFFIFSSNQPVVM